MENSDESGSGKSGQQVNYTKPATTRLTNQTYEKFVQYTEQEGIGKSEGLRRLARIGLDHELADDQDEQEQTSSGDTGTGFLILGTILGVGVLLGYLSGGGNPDQWLPWLVVGLLATGAYLKYQP